MQKVKIFITAFYLDDAVNDLNKYLKENPNERIVNIAVIDGGIIAVLEERETTIEDAYKRLLEGYEEAMFSGVTAPQPRRPKTYKACAKAVPVSEKENVFVGVDFGKECDVDNNVAYAVQHSQKRLEEEYEHRQEQAERKERINNLMKQNMHNTELVNGASKK